MTRVDETKDLFGTLVIVNASVINREMLEYLDYENYKCRKKLVDKLVEDCSKNIDENEMITVTLNNHGRVCGSCTIYIVF